MQVGTCVYDNQTGEKGTIIAVSTARKSLRQYLVNCRLVCDAGGDKVV